MAAQKDHPRPEHVFIGAKTYEVQWLDEEGWAKNHLSDGDSGLTYASQNTIFMRLLPGATEGNYQEVLLHEVTHAAWAETHLTHMTGLLVKDETELEEAVIGVQSPMMLFVLQQNPGLVAYLTSNGAVRR